MNTKSSSPKGNTKEQIERRRADVARMYFEEGKTLAEIAGLVHISVEMVRKDKDLCLQYWRSKASDSISIAKQRELDRLDMIEQQAMQAYKRTVGNHTIVTTKSTTVTSVDGSGETTILPGIEETRKTEKLAGEPRLLEVIQDCIRQRREILGLDAPKKVTGSDGGPVRFVIEGLAGAPWIPAQQGT